MFHHQIKEEHYFVPHTANQVQSSFWGLKNKISKIKVTDSARCAPNTFSGSHDSFTTWATPHTPTELCDYLKFLLNRLDPIFFIKKTSKFKFSYDAHTNWTTSSTKCEYVLYGFVWQLNGETQQDVSIVSFEFSWTIICIVLSERERERDNKYLTVSAFISH